MKSIIILELEAQHAPTIYAGDDLVQTEYENYGDGRMETRVVMLNNLDGKYWERGGSLLYHYPNPSNHTTRDYYYLGTLLNETILKLPNSIRLFLDSHLGVNWEYTPEQWELGSKVYLIRDTYLQRTQYPTTIKGELGYGYKLLSLTEELATLRTKEGYVVTCPRDVLSTIPT